MMAFRKMKKSLFFWRWVCLAALLLAALHGTCPAEEENYVHQLEELIAKGDGEALFAMAMLYEYGEQGVERSPHKAFDLLQQAGKAQVTAACLYLGIKYENGGDTPRDLVAARRWYCRAAKEGWAMAQFFLAGLYEKGKGGEQDITQALAWYMLAAKQGYPGAEEAVIRLQRELTPLEVKKAIKLRDSLLLVECPGW